MSTFSEYKPSVRQTTRNRQRRKAGHAPHIGASRLHSRLIEHNSDLDELGSARSREYRHIYAHRLNLMRSSRYVGMQTQFYLGYSSRVLRYNDRLADTLHSLMAS